MIARTMDGAGVLLILIAVVLTAVVIVIAILECRDWLRRCTILREPNHVARMALAFKLFGARGLDVLQDIEEKRRRDR